MLLGQVFCADVVQEDALEEQSAAFRGFIWRTAVIVARHLQAKARLSQDDVAAKVWPLPPSRLAAERSSWTLCAGVASEVLFCAGRRAAGAARRGGGQGSCPRGCGG
jgi:hypothetical protein